jgi:outer membrane protein insertion porin family
MFGTPTLFGADLYNVNRELNFGDEEFSEQSLGLGVKLGRRLRWPDDYFQIVGRYTLEQLRYYDFNDVYRTRYVDTPNSLLRYENDYLTTSAVGLTISRDSRDLPQFATSGSVVALNNEVSGWALGGDWKYYKTIFDATKYTRVWWKIALVTKMRLGVIDSPEGDAGIPYAERFAPGGTYTDGMIRGYDDGTVGPLNSDGGLLRGRSVLVYNAELQIPVVDQQIYALLFADAGNAWLSGKAIKPFDLDREDGLKKSVGAGFRVVVPGLGTIGFDFGYGYNNPDGAGWKPHFQIGRSF